MKMTTKLPKRDDENIRDRERKVCVCSVYLQGCTFKVYLCVLDVCGHSNSLGLTSVSYKYSKYPLFVCASVCVHMNTQIVYVCVCVFWSHE